MRAVGRVEFLQNVPDVHFHGALLHIQSGRDQFVWFALAQKIEHRKFTGVRSSSTGGSRRSLSTPIPGFAVAERRPCAGI